jgi:hypothetical protein
LQRYGEHAADERCRKQPNRLPPWYDVALTLRNQSQYLFRADGDRLSDNAAFVDQKRNGRREHPVFF